MKTKFLVYVPLICLYLTSCGNSSSQVKVETADNSDSIVLKVDSAYVKRQEAEQAESRKYQEAEKAQDSNSMSPRENDIWNSIRGKWYASSNTGYDKSAGELASITEYEINIEGKHVVIRTAKANYTVSYEAHVPPLTLRADCQLELTNFNEASINDYDQYKLDLKDCSKDAALRLFVKYEQGKFSSMSVDNSIDEVELSRNKPN